MKVIFETPNLFAAYTNLIQAECLDENCAALDDEPKEDPENPEEPE